ncbi:MAG: hypothetical protein O6943_00270, partial [Bacteroidetes bacterium]|nr:hypothetical protein [Bacteroidota bacterium]
MKKITLLIALLVCSVGFGQISVGSAGDVNQRVTVQKLSDVDPTTYVNSNQQRTTNQNISIEDNSNSDVLSNTQGASRVFIPRVQDQTLLKNTVTTSSYLTGVFSYSDYLSNGNVPITRAVSSDRNTVVVNTNRNSGVIDTYTDLTTFNANVAGGLTSEDFGGSPVGGGISACGPIINSTGDGTCFLAGEIVDGFDLTASNGTDVVYIGAGAIGNPSTLVGANTFAEFTIVTFTGDPVFEVAHDIWNNGDVDTDYRVYDTGGGLIQSFNLNNTVQTENFFGIISPIEIGHIEIQGLNDSGELFGNFLFTAPGGGGGGPCDQMTVTPGGGVENGRGCSSNNSWVASNDFIVPTGQDAELTSLIPQILVNPGQTILTADVTLYDDVAGLPGAVLDAQVGIVPTSQPMIGSAFGLDLLAVTLDVTPLSMPGDAGMDVTYWIAVQVTTSDGGNAFWEDQSPDVIGEFLAFSPDNGASWSIPATRDGVYTYVA